jgi:hypothetical protein
MWLVQRLENKTFSRPDVKGVDAIVSYDYMGSAEFEWGALPQALKQMREVAAISTEKIILQKVEHVMRDDKDKKVTHKAYFVGPASLAPIAGEFFVSELTEENKKRLKEPTMIRYAYQIERRSEHYHQQLVGWWVLDDTPPWAIFKDEAVAREWMKRVYSPEKVC